MMEVRAILKIQRTVEKGGALWVGGRVVIAACAPESQETVGPINGCCQEPDWQGFNG